MSISLCSSYTGSNPVFIVVSSISIQRFVDCADNGNCFFCKSFLKRFFHVRFGQCVDLISEGESKPTEDKVKYLHLHKTSCLIKAPVVCGAIIGGASKAEIKALEVFSDNLGLAFQITDDILDVEGDSALLGKNVGSDENNGKMTYPAVFGLEGAKGLADLHISMAIDSLNGFKQSQNLIELTKSIRNRRK